MDSFMAVTIGLLFSIGHLIVLGLCFLCPAVWPAMCGLDLFSSEVTTLASPLPVTSVMCLHESHVHWVLVLERSKATGLSGPGYKI